MFLFHVTVVNPLGNVYIVPINATNKAEAAKLAEDNGRQAVVAIEQLV